ncbi:MAG: anti-sigma factor [Candidatus Dormibacteria bacterium]
MTCEEVREGSASFALGLLERDEDAEVRAHVAGCDPCRRAIDEMVEVVGVLPLSLDPVAPPAGLRERILAAATAEPGLPARIVQLPRKPVHGFTRVSRFAGWAAAAAVVVAVGAAGGAYYQAGHGPRVYQLRGAGQASSASGRLVVLRSDRVALLEVHGLPESAPGQVYAAWVLDHGKPLNVGTFQPDATGRASLAVNGDLGPYQQFAVTLEQAPVGAVPAGPVILSENL